MGTIGENGNDWDEVDDDNLHDGVPGAGLDVDGGDAVHRPQPVQGDPSQAQSGNVYGDALQYDTQKSKITSLSLSLYFLESNIKNLSSVW